MSFRGTRVVHHQCDPCVSEPIPMRKPPTGEPCAGEPHARFGGRGRREPFPTPIDLGINSKKSLIRGGLLWADAFPLTGTLERLRLTSAPGFCAHHSWGGRRS